MKNILISGLLLGLSAIGVSAAAKTSTIDIACIRTAVKARETTLSSSVSTLAANWTSAYSLRSAAIQNAWALSDSSARKTALKKAWSDYKATMKQSRDSLLSSRKAAWAGYRTAAKSCKGINTSDEKATETSDTQSL